MRLFERCAAIGPLTVGVNSDRFVAEYRGAPVHDSEFRRMRNVAQIRCVLDVQLNDGPGIDLIRRLRPQVVAVGPDWLDRDYTRQIGTTADELADLGVSVLFLPRTPGVSSSELRAA